MLQVFRYEFVLLLTRENVSISTPHLYFLMVSIGVGIIIRYLTSAITMAIFSLIILARTLFMVFREPDPSSAILDFFGRIAPIFFSAVFCFIGTYHNDKLSRRNFVRGKRIKLEILRLSKHRKLVSKLLHLMLPASVIPRLKALEMDFSTIVDDIEQGYCVFLDLCDGRGIMDIQRRIQVINMNFGRFDEFLEKVDGV
ncbi:hypothetical protein BC829DRAFT_189415 [Chytridium lagenaria]|nr:hypothetical protein BC829DRAFT_189415 [Chytridium lagenaria]